MKNSATSVTLKMRYLVSWEYFGVFILASLRSGTYRIVLHQIQSDVCVGRYGYVFLL